MNENVLYAPVINTHLSSFTMVDHEGLLPLESFLLTCWGIHRGC